MKYRQFVGATAHHFKLGKLNWKTIALFAAFIVAIVCLVPALNGCFNNNAEDPNWHKTHITITSPEEAVRLFGNDLLLDKLVLKESYSEPYTEYILAHDDKGSDYLKNRQTWRELSIQVNYSGEQFNTDDDYVHLHILFKENDRALVGSEKYPNDGYEHMLEGSTTSREINGITIRYHEFPDKVFAYPFCAEFKYQGYTYFIETYSKANQNLSWDTINQMLG